MPNQSVKKSSGVAINLAALRIESRSNGVNHLIDAVKAIAHAPNQGSGFIQWDGGFAAFVKQQKALVR